MIGLSGPNHPPPPVWPGGKLPARAVQRAGAEAVFAPHARVLRALPPPRAVAEELVARPGGAGRGGAAEPRRWAGFDTPVGVNER